MNNANIVWYFENFYPGQVLELGSCAVTEDAIIAFATQFDPQPFHLDHAKAAQSIFGGVIASGWHTCSMMMRLVVDNLLSTSSSMGSPGLDQVRWIKPVRPNDSLTLTIHVKEVRASSSKPDRGIVLAQWQAMNQHGELVSTVEGMFMFGRRLSIV